MTQQHIKFVTATCQLCRSNVSAMSQQQIKYVKNSINYVTATCRSCHSNVSATSQQDFMHVLKLCHKPHQDVEAVTIQPHLSNNNSQLLPFHHLRNLTTRAQLFQD
ncbi:hypothetical protein ACKWTF_000652 [Chironomus riparius]